MITNTSDQWSTECIARARELARWQCSDMEISAAIAIECLSHDHNLGDEFVKAHAQELQKYRLYGRAKLRGKLHKLADGDATLAKTMSRSSVAALELIGKQHLGYTGQGFDAKIRKAAEKAEAQRAGFRVITGVTGGAA